MDPWIHGSAAGAAAGAAASAATLCTLSCRYRGGGAKSAPYDYVTTYSCTAVAEAAAPAAAQAALVAAPAADPWIHGSIFYILNHIFYFETYFLL